MQIQITHKYKHKYKLLRILFHWISAGGDGGIALVGMSAVNTTLPRAWIVLSLRLLATLFVNRNKNTNKIQKYKHNSATDRYCWDLTDVTLFAKLQCYQLLILFVDEEKRCQPAVTNLRCRKLSTLNGSFSLLQKQHHWIGLHTFTVFAAVS